MFHVLLLIYHLACHCNSCQTTGKIDLARQTLNTATALGADLFGFEEELLACICMLIII